MGDVCDYFIWCYSESVIEDDAEVTGAQTEPENPVFLNIEWWKKKGAYLDPNQRIYLGQKNLEKNKRQPTPSENLTIRSSEGVTLKTQNEIWVYLNDEWH